MRRRKRRWWSKVKAEYVCGGRDMSIPSRSLEEFCSAGIPGSSMVTVATGHNLFLCTEP